MTFNLLENDTNYYYYYLILVKGKTAHTHLQMILVFDTESSKMSM